MNETFQGQQLCDFQIHDKENGLVMPWFTHGCLNWIKSQDWSEKIVVMFGAGLGDAWLAKRCKYLIVVERNAEWLAKSHNICKDNGVTNVTYHYRQCNDSDGMADFYLQLPPHQIDVIINDDAYRTEACLMAVDYFKGKGGIFICDNWYQSYVWLSDRSVEIMRPYLDDALIFEQEGHTDHDGINKWKTAIFFIK